MTMLSYRECDNCQKRVLVNLIKGWMNLRPMVGNDDEIRELLEETDKRDLPTGDFCSYLCLGQWAFGQQTIRDLREEEPSDS